jgi:hypothetical protein
MIDMYGKTIITLTVILIFFYYLLKYLWVSYGGDVVSFKKIKWFALLWLLLYVTTMVMSIMWLWG